MKAKFRILYLFLSSISVLTFMLTGCSTSSKEDSSSELSGIKAGRADQVVLIPGLSYNIVARWGDLLNESERFGYNPAGMTFIREGRKSGYLWVNHEDVTSQLVVDYKEHRNAKMRSQIIQEMTVVGGSYLKLKDDGGWKVSKNEDNLRFTGSQNIPISNVKLNRKEGTFGTLGTTASTLTPWGTILISEGDYRKFYGDIGLDSGNYISSEYGWEAFFPRNGYTEYGWVNEFDPKTKSILKHTHLGRYVHGDIEILEDEDQIVIYLSESDKNGNFFKYVTDKSDWFAGKMYAANFTESKWESLSFERPEFQGFRDELDLLTHLKKACKIIGLGELDYPGGIAIVNDRVYLAIKGDPGKENYHGSILEIKEQGVSSKSTTFDWDTFMEGGKEASFSMPKVLERDNVGNLWFTTAIPSNRQLEEIYFDFGNNGLFLIPTKGPNQGKAVRIAHAPIDAEFGGLTFVDDESIFLSVQHPGEMSPTPLELTSTWPNGSFPAPAVISIKGDLIKEIISK